MAVYKRDSGFWFVQFAFQGRTYIKSSKSKKKSDAMTLEVKMREDLQKYVIQGMPKEIKCEDAIELFLDHQKGKTGYQGSLSCSRWYAPKLKGLYMHQITTQLSYELIRVKQKEGISQSTIISYRNFLVGLKKLCKVMGYLVNEFEMPKLAKPKNKLRFLTIDEESRLLEELSPFRKSKGLNGIDDRSDDMQKFIQDNYDFAVLCLDTGCRFSEMANLKWENVDLETGEVHLYRTKTKNQTTLYLTNRAWDILRTRFETKKTSYIFTNKSGEGAKYTTNGIKTAFARAGMPECSVHTLRHTFASRLVQSGVSIQEVQLMLGHSKIATTMIYAHLEQSKTTKKVRDVLNNIHTQQQVA